MKIKKNTLLLLAISITFIGCMKEYVYISSFVYNNESSWDITVESHSPDNRLDSIFVIPRGGSHTIELDSEGGFPYPFMWRSSNRGSLDYAVFSNQNKQFIHRVYPLEPTTNNLYQFETYKLVHSEQYKRTYQYTFTDADFTDAASIIPITKLDIAPFWDEMEIHGHALYVIRSADELRKLITEPMELPQIDFAQNSVIIIVGDSYGKDLLIDVSLLRKNDGNYDCEVILKGIHGWTKWGKAFTTPIISSTATVDFIPHYFWKSPHENIN